MEDIIDIIVTETTNLIEITSQPTDEIIDVNIIDNREDVTLNVTPNVVEININSLTGNFGINWGEITGTLSNQTDLNTALGLKADLIGGKVPSSQLPSYVDDVVEVANYAALPATGETGKIYVTIDTNYIYRWTGSVYVEIKDSSAVWGAITGTLSNQTDLQNALNLKANDNAVVHLAGTETITGAKTFSSAITAPNFVLSGGTGNTGLYYGHTDRVVLANYTAGGIDFEVNGGSIVATLFPSGNYGLGITLDAGYKLDVNGTARISGALSGTSASFSSSITASSIIKSGGTSSQFLKADGSVDSSTYLTTSSAASTYVPYTGANSAVNLGAYDLTVNGIKVGRGAGSISDNTVVGASALTSNTTGSSNTAIGFSSLSANTIAGGNTAIGTYALSANISGGTNTAIGYSAGSSITTGSNNVIIGGYAGTSSMSGNVILSDGGGNIRFQWDGTNIKLNGNTVGSNAYTSTAYLPLSGGTLTGALSGTSATFSGNVTVNGSSIDINPASGQPNITLRTANTFRGYIEGNSAGGLSFGTGAGAAICLTLASTGAATFSSSVTASALSLSNTDGYFGTINSTGANGGYFAWQTSGTTIADIGTLAQIFGSGGSTNFGINARGARDLAFGTNNTERMRITSSGNIGIGTTSPQVLLQIGEGSLSNTTTNQYLRVNAGVYNAASTSNLDLFNFGNNFGNALGWRLTSGTEGVGVSVGRYLSFNTVVTDGSGNPSTATERMRITSSGNVGIGTTSPANYTNYITQTINGTNGAIVQLQSSGTPSLRLIGEGVDSYLDNVSTGALIFRTTSSSSERMRITSGGNVGIGTTSPSYKLSIVGDLRGYKLISSEAGVGAGNYTIFSNDDNVGYIDTIRAVNSGDFHFRFDGTSRANINRTTGIYMATSDSALKTNILDSKNVLPLIDKIKVRSYNWIENNAYEPYGLIAQELNEILPEYVYKPKTESESWGLSKAELVPVLIKAIQELKSKIETLENK